ncbi:MAG TPA: penicillin-binding protein 2 [Candidatus Limnocylindrales bacterium]
MLGRTDSRRRLLLLLAVLVFLSGGMTARLAYWQVSQHDQLSGPQAADQTATQRTVAARRGTIYDRTGTIVLAQTVDRYRLVADLHDLSDAARQRDADALVDYLSLDPGPEATLRKAMAGKGYYVILAKNIDAQIAQDISTAQKNNALPEVTLEPTPVRVYPQAGGAPHTSLAAQLLGFVNAAGVGQYGLEQQYDTILTGKPEVISVDPNQAGSSGEHIVDLGQDGEDIRTTIDAGLQLQVEQEVFSTWLADKAKAVSAVVMDPKSGAVLAEATYPSYDANYYSQVAAQDPSLFVDPVISEVYEPGSTFKMLTASAALDSKTTALTTKINDTGVLSLPGGQEVADADRKSTGWRTFSDIVAWSRNVGVSQVAFKLGKNTAAASAVLYKTWQTYGIGTPTGIDLAGEATRGVRDPAKTPWAQIDLANASFGQGVAVTPIQIMKAYSEMANGGLAVTPYVRDPEPIGSTQSAASSAAQTRVIPAALAGQLTGLMQYVVTAVPSYDQATWIPNYFVGGKTGTAQIWDQTLNKGKGDWMQDIYNYSFYGWVGQDRPDLAIGVVIYQGRPTKIGQGILAMPMQSTELFRRIATDAVVAEKIPPSKNGPPPPSGKTAKPLG